MTASFSFHVDPERDLVRIRMGGFFRSSDIAAFLEARRVAHRKLRCPPNAHVTINDLRDMSIQSQDVVDAFHAMLAAPEYRSRRLAFVVGYTLARAQAIRALESRRARWFEDPAAAEAWLFSDEGAASEAEAPRRRAAG
jgi:hypothetical protein